MNITLEIFRFDPERDSEPRFQTYQLEVEPNNTILDALTKVRFELDGSLNFRRSCNHAICGSCALTINHESLLACHTLVRDCKPQRPIRVEPLKSYPVIRDLVIDMDRFYEKLVRVKPFFSSELAAPYEERRQSPAEQSLIDEAASCILCGSCISSCPSFWGDDDYLGPAVLLKAYRYVFDTRDTDAAARLERISDRDGLWRCHNIANCMEACPKEIKLTHFINKLKVEAFLSGI
jgi:succinate dehydrogenase / fumarate reductase, iron-sulfur subunit